MGVADTAGLVKTLGASVAGELRSLVTMTRDMRRARAAGTDAQPPLPPAQFHYATLASRVCALYNALQDAARAPQC